MCVSKIGGPCTVFATTRTEPFRNGTGTHNSKFNPLNFPTIQCIPYAECVVQKHTLFKGTHPQEDNSGISPGLFSPTFTSRHAGSAERGICECNDNFIETKKGMCSLPYGASCDTSSKNKKDQCAEPLKCVSNKCGCQNEVDIYDEDLRQCFKSVGSLCTKDSSCVKNAECRKRKKGKDVPGRCKCISKYRLTVSGICV
jgi:hypothetical protein